MAQNRESKRTADDAAGWPADEYSADLGHGGEEGRQTRDATASSRPLGHHEAPEVHARLGKTADSVTVLQPGTRLQQGSTYLDLERLDEGPFVALAGQEVGDGQLITAKKELDYETWNALVGEGPGRGGREPSA